MSDEIEAEVDRNYDYFQSVVGSLMADHAGRFALLRHEGIEGYFDNAGDAFRAGATRFEDGLFSIQEVNDKPIDLGFFSHVAGNR